MDAYVIAPNRDPFAILFVELQLALSHLSAHIHSQCLTRDANDIISPESKPRYFSEWPPKKNSLISSKA
jgi:hypothetical protein